jgi:hypothetical protein
MHHALLSIEQRLSDAGSRSSDKLPAMLILFFQQQPQSSLATRQKYEEAKQELQALLSRKKQVDNNLVCLKTLSISQVEWALK